MCDLLLFYNKFIFADFNPSHAYDVFVNHEAQYEWNITFVCPTWKANVFYTEALFEDSTKTID
jgi:hypothetical protein